MRDATSRHSVWTLFVMMIVWAALSIPSTAEANAALRLYPDVADGGGGQLVSHTPFELNIANDGHGNGDNTAYEVQLVVAVADVEPLTQVTLSDTTGTIATITGADLLVGTPEFLCDGRAMPPHGVYPTAYTTVALGDIPAGTTVTLTVDISGQDGLMVHFDAFGRGIKNNGDCQDVYNPNGHDVTAIIDEGGGGPGPSDCEVDVDKTADVDAVQLDDELVFSITAQNLSECDLTGATLTDVLPIVVDDTGVEHPAFSVLNTSPEADVVSPTEVVWDLGGLGPLASFIATMTVLFDEPLADGHEVVNAACFDAVELDDIECDSTTVAVGDVDTDDAIGGPGFWCRQIRAAMDEEPNALYTVDELDEWLEQINDSSAVFPEHGSTETLAAVRELLCRPNLLRTAEDRLLRHLMTLWFNLVTERVTTEVTLEQLCQGDEPVPDGANLEWTVGYVFEQAELAVTDEADDETLLFWKDVIDFINNCGEPGSCQTFRSSDRVRRYRP